MLQSWRGKGFGRNHLIKIPVLPWRLVSVHAYMVFIVMCDLYAYQATFLEAWLVLVLDGLESGLYRQVMVLKNGWQSVQQHAATKKNW